MQLLKGPRCTRVHYVLSFNKVVASCPRGQAAVFGGQGEAEAPAVVALPHAGDAAHASLRAVHAGDFNVSREAS